MGMNRRNFKFISKYNDRRLYPLVDDKVQTKTLAQRHGITTPHLIGVIEHQYEVKDLLKIIGANKDFVIKPAHGSGGKGVLVIKSFSEDCFVKASGETLTFHDVYKHISNILSGLYSLGGQYDVAVIEELVHFSNIFKGLTEEIFVVAYINKNSLFENYETLAQGDLTSVKLNKIDMTRSIIYNKAVSVITAHNHPFGSAQPSRADYDSFVSLCTFFASLGVVYVDNIIIGKDGMFSFKQKALIEKDLLEK